MVKFRRKLGVSIALLASFVLWTIAVRFVDVRPIGPQGSSVGFAEINRFVHSLTGVHLALYTITDWLGLIPAGACAGFGVLGLIQWIKRKRILSVDFSILILGGFYILVIAAYLFFEDLVINYRPVLIDGHLEASYPSSTTVLTMCAMSTAAMQLSKRIGKRRLRRCTLLIICSFTAFMVVGRLVSGVHWFTDIVGGVLLSAGLVTVYSAICSLGAQ